MKFNEYRYHGTFLENFYSGWDGVEFQDGKLRYEKLFSFMIFMTIPMATDNETPVTGDATNFT